MEAMRNAPKKRTSNFREDETKLLIQLWGSPQIQNKLYLTHRKAPVMRLIAANMEKHGFYRTPDEIKTRIRNLKCLYHRIKKSLTTGAGILSVDPDWPHFKAMDEILTKKSQKRQQELLYRDNILFDPEVKIKEEADEIDINDDMESYSTNSNGSDDEFDETPSLPPLTPAPRLNENKDETNENSNPIKIAPKPASKLFPTVHIPIQKANNNTPVNITPNSMVNSTQVIGTPLNGGAVNGNSIRTGAAGTSIPFPLLILNGMTNGQNGNPVVVQPKTSTPNSGRTNNMNSSDIAKLLNDLIDVQNKNLEIERQRLEIEKSKVEYERIVGAQLLSLIPMFGSILQKLEFGGQRNFDDHKPLNGKKRSASETMDYVSDAKILRDVLQNGIKRSLSDEEEVEDHDSDSGVTNDSRESNK